MENKSGRKNVAFCIGDLEGGKMLLQGFCKVLGDNLIKYISSTAVPASTMERRII